MSKTKIGFIGTGIMGHPMAQNLQRAGYPLTISTRTKAKTNDLIAAGAIWADTPAQVAQASDILITCLPDTPDVQQILLGDKGVIQGANPGLICVDTSTISPSATKKMGAQLADKGITLMDAPISGGQIGAIEAKLSIMIGGDKETFTKVLPVMEVMGKAVTLCGPLGSGQTTKLANQVMVIHTIMSIAEGLAFAEKAGLDLETTWKVTSAGAASSHSLKALGPKIIAGDFAPAFMVDLQMKDLRLVTEYADKIGQPLPGVGLAKQLLSALQAQGKGKQGTQALINIIRQLAGR